MSTAALMLLTSCAMPGHTGLTPGTPAPTASEAPSGSEATSGADAESSWLYGIVGLRLVDAGDAWAYSADAVYRSQDGGRTWTRRSFADMEPTERRITDEATATGRPAVVAAAFLDRDHAIVLRWFLTGQPNSGTGHESDRLPVDAYVTEDGGQTWSRNSFQIVPADSVAAEVSLADPDHVFALFHSGPAGGLMTKALLATSDGGRTWDELMCDCAPSAAFGRARGRTVNLGSFYVTGVTFPTPSDGWMTGTYHGEPDVPLFRTRDGGSSWTKVDAPMPSETPPVHYANAFPPRFEGASGGRLHGGTSEERRPLRASIPARLQHPLRCPGGSRDGRHVRVC